MSNLSEIHEFALGHPTFDDDYQLRKDRDRCYMFLPHAYSWCTGCRLQGYVLPFISLIKLSIEKVAFYEFGHHQHLITLHLPLIIILDQLI